jgi:hypothetical protein
MISNEMVKLRFERLVKNLNKNPTIKGLPDQHALGQGREVKWGILTNIKGISVHTNKTTESEPAVYTMSMTRHGVRRSDARNQRPRSSQSKFEVHLSWISSEAEISFHIFPFFKTRGRVPWTNAHTQRRKKETQRTIQFSERYAVWISKFFIFLIRV